MTTKAPIKRRKLVQRTYRKSEPQRSMNRYKNTKISRSVKSKHRTREGHSSLLLLLLLWVCLCLLVYLAVIHCWILMSCSAGLHIKWVISAVRDIVFDFTGLSTPASKPSVPSTEEPSVPQSSAPASGDFFSFRDLFTALLFSGVLVSVM